MIFLRYFTVLLILFSLAACQSSPAEKRQEADLKKRSVFHYRLGLDALHKGSLPRAFEELLLAEKIVPNQPSTLDAIGHAWRLRGNLIQAKKYYERAIHNGAGSSTYNNYGNLLVEMQNYTLAIEHLKTALGDPRYPNQAFAFTNLGDAYIGLNQFEEGISAYRKAHMLAPKQDYAQLREAAAYIKFKRINYAQALYETILRKNPVNQQALAGLIKLLENQPQSSLLQTYISNYIKKTNNAFGKAWAKDELARLVQKAKDQK